MTGSPLDSPPSGGRFDGVADAVAAVEAVEAMRQAKFAHTHSIEIVNFAAEEVSVRFDLPMIGSSATIGALHPEALGARDRITGLTLREVLTAAGIETAALLDAERHREV